MCSLATLLPACSSDWDGCPHGGWRWQYTGYQLLEAIGFFILMRRRLMRMRPKDIILTGIACNFSATLVMSLFLVFLDWAGWARSLSFFWQIVLWGMAFWDRDLWGGGAPFGCERAAISIINHGEKANEEMNALAQVPIQTKDIPCIPGATWCSFCYSWLDAPLPTYRFLQKNWSTLHDWPAIGERNCHINQRCLLLSHR